MKQSRRRLPHVYPEGKPLFLTWHLHGSLPHALYPPPAKLSSGKAFVWIDRYLDTTRTGPAFLARPAVAQIIVEGIERGERELRHYDLHAFVVMPNHVHLLLTPCVDPSRFLQSLKGFTAREANKLLRRTGEPFLATRILRSLGAQRPRAGKNRLGSTHGVSSTRHGDRKM